MRKRKMAEAGVGYAFIAPCTILLIVFTILPILISLYLGFTEFSGFNTPTWVGFKNYVSMWKDQFFTASIQNTFKYVLITVPIQTALSLFFAAILARRSSGRFRDLVRGVMFIPVLCASSVSAKIFSFIFASDSSGYINSLLALFGIEKINWLGQFSTALWVVCITAIWKNVGYFLVIFYASIMDVPKSLQEAARMDGATPIQEFFCITLPTIKPVFYLVLTLSTIWSFQAFDIVFAMTRGGPGKATYMPVMVVYNSAFKSGKMGYACAVALVLGLLILIVTLIQRVAFKEKVGGENG